MKKPKVFVSGCFDLLHSGHVYFLEEAATYGMLYIGLGSDDTVKELKGRYPINNEQERKYMLESLKCVKTCFVNRGSGMLDFVDEMRRVSPDFFIVNSDGDSRAKAKLCRELGIKYVVLKRTPQSGLPARSTTGLRAQFNIPYRLDLAGGWLDQPYVSKYASGAVITISLEPDCQFNERSGMASSTRRRAIELWQTDVPPGDKHRLAKMLFAWENPPGAKYFSGSQDSIGIVFPGLNRLDYEGDYWPSKITSEQNEGILRWVEEHLYLVELRPRKLEYAVHEDTAITAARAKRLAAAADQCWQAILRKDLREFGEQFRASFEAQISMFSHMVDRETMKVIKQYAGLSLGWKLSGAGGGGYLVLVSDRAIPGARQIKIRRKQF